MRFTPGKSIYDCSSLILSDSAQNFDGRIQLIQESVWKQHTAKFSRICMAR
jgi:hypothetical protein